MVNLNKNGLIQFMMLLKNYNIIKNISDMMKNIKTKLIHLLGGISR